ncbi:lysophospholipid acyltransferase family protein [Halioxenophilus aromaticivorans]|uniref:Phospholipid/glycerol acyltransferase domain-containing protein n=1 Tax=Halioxenophilus aromaticivorans TaxID=1306992 RepID=A0AAV3U0U1_9ALTE
MSHHTSAGEANPFQIPRLARWLAAPMEWATGLKALARLYRARPEEARGAQQYHEFLSFALKSLKAGLEPDDYGALGHIPAQGPVIFVANHPLGALEGLAMTDMLLHIRPDTKVLTNELLTQVPELQSVFFGVDVLSGNAQAANTRGMRSLYKHLGTGGAVLIYPAGEVSGFNTHSGQIQDPAWQPLVGRLARRYQAACVPFWVQGRNSWWFYALGVVHPFLRTLRLPKELLNKRGTRFKLLVGKTIEAQRLVECANDRAATAYLRHCCELLARKAGIKPAGIRVMKVKKGSTSVEQSDIARGK